MLRSVLPFALLAQSTVKATLTPRDGQRQPGIIPADQVDATNQSSGVTDGSVVLTISSGSTSLLSNSTNTNEPVATNEDIWLPWNAKDMYIIIKWERHSQEVDFAAVSALLENARADLSGKPSATVIEHGEYKLPEHTLNFFWFKNMQRTEYGGRELTYGEVAEMLSTVMIPWTQRRQRGGLPFYDFYYDVRAYGSRRLQYVATGLLHASSLSSTRNGTGTGGGTQ